MDLIGNHLRVGTSEVVLDLITEKLADACQQVPEVLEQIQDGIHASLIARKASDGNLP